MDEHSEYIATRNLTKALLQLHQSVPLQTTFSMHESFGRDYGFPLEHLCSLMNTFAISMNRKCLMYTVFD